MSSVVGWLGVVGWFEGWLFAEGFECVSEVGEVFG